MKILHTGDWHLGAYVGPQCDDPMKRMENTCKCLDFLVETAQKEQPDIILICGDIFHTAKVWSERSNIELRTSADYIRALARIAPVAVLYGTPNHDSYEQFKSLVWMSSITHKVYFFIEPELCTINTKSGPIQIAGLPGFDKGHFRAKFPGLSVEEENHVFSQQLDVIIQGLSAQLDPDLPSVLMAHHTVVGCELDNGQHVFQANEVVINSNTLDNSNFDLVCLGHIHKAQLVLSCNKPVYYSGSLDAFTFNDEDHVKGFWIHNIGGTHKFYETPARKFKTIKLDQLDQNEIKNNHYVYVEDHVVRILYTCDSETEKALDKKKLERDLYVAGAYYVSEICPEKVTTTVNKERMTEKLTVSECLERYLKEKGKTETEISSLMSEAVDIIAKVSASLPAGNQTGLFLPLEIEVRNYRSYAEENLSFEDIYFAMVNGRNGSGKSSLFMDAIVDCLYEEPREGDLTGWIRNGEKFGSITFTFQLGSSIYRVTRTRQKSGKATLALARKEEDQWIDYSCERMTDTQKKIFDLLGMDADTFRSCVLIMQDQYGKFMEAKPEDRMAVLANLLGLGIYEQLEKEAKSQLTEVNRELKTVKEEVSALDQELEQLDSLQSELNVKKVDLRTAEETLTLLKKQKDETATKVISHNQLKQERDRIFQEIRKKESSIQEKNRNLTELTKNIVITKSFLLTEDELNKKHNELQEVKQQLAIMDSKAKVAKDKQLQVDKLTIELSSLEAEKSKLEKSIKDIEERLKDVDTLEKTIEQLKGAEEALASWEEKEKKDKEYHQQLVEYQAELAKIKQQIEMYKKQTTILEDSNCIDIENAQCGFLKAAKEAKSKLDDLIKIEAEQHSIISKLTNERLELGYNFEEHKTYKELAQAYRKIQQQLASLEGEKKLREVHSIQYTGVINRINATQNEKELLENDLRALQQELSEYNNLQAKVEELEQSERNWLKLPAAKQYLETAEKQADELCIEIEQLNTEVQDYKGRVTELAVQIEDLQKYHEMMQELDRTIETYEAAIASYNRSIGSLEEKLTTLMSKKEVLEEKEKAVSELAGKSARLQVLSEAFSQDGIPHQIIRDIIPELEASANEILSQMTRGRMRLEFRTERTLKSNKSKEIATLDIVLIDIDNGELPYLSRSGGQKVRAALAVSFALAMVKASRVGLQLGMMFVDEPPFLDAEGVEAYCTALESIHEKYPEMRIVAISHDENMKARFPQQITVVTGDSGSRIQKG